MIKFYFLYIELLLLQETYDEENKYNKKYQVKSMITHPQGKKAAQCDYDVHSNNLYYFLLFIPSENVFHVSFFVLCF